MLDNIFGNLYGIPFGLDVGIEIGSLYGSFDGYNDDKLERFFLGDSLRSTDGKVPGSDEGII